MESELVRADGRSAGGTDPTVPVRDRVPGPDLAPVLPPGRCSSSRHAQHCLPQRVAQHSRPGEGGAEADRKPGPLQAGTIGAPAPKWGQLGSGKRRQFRPLVPGARAAFLTTAAFTLLASTLAALILRSHRPAHAKTN